MIDRKLKGVTTIKQLKDLGYSRIARRNDMNLETWINLKELNYIEISRAPKMMSVRIKS